MLSLILAMAIAHGSSAGPSKVSCSIANDQVTISGETYSFPGGRPYATTYYGLNITTTTGGANVVTPASSTGTYVYALPTGTTSVQVVQLKEHGNYNFLGSTVVATCYA